MSLQQVTWSLARVTSVLALAVSVACDGGDEDARARARIAQARTPAQPVAERASTEEDTPEAAELGDEEALAAVIEVVEVEVESEGDARGSARELATEAVTPAAASLAWTSRGSLAGDLAFIEIGEGLALRSEAGVHALVFGADEGLELGEPVSVELPSSPLLGSWPDDLWRVSSRAANHEQLDYQLFRLEPASKDGQPEAWVAQPYRKRERFTAAAGAVRAAGEGGLLVLEDTRVWRVGSRRPLAKVGQRMGKVVLAAVESRSGVLFNISLRTNGVYVQRGCPDRACVDRHARRLPHGSEWVFGAHALRGRETFTLLARANIEGMSIEHLLHQDRDGWVLESLGEAPRGVWGSATGGLWMRMKNALWYRSPAGSWHELELPGEGTLSVALSGERDELWIARSATDETSFHSLPATPAQFAESP